MDRACRGVQLNAPTRPEHRNRRSIRLPTHDYASPGAYFVTICTARRECLFGEVVEGEVRLSAIGAIVNDCWTEIQSHVTNVETDAFVVMPNHVHGILVIHDGRTDRRGVQLNAPTRPDAPTPANGPTSPRNGLPVIVRTFKAAVTTLCRRLGQIDDVWQRNYYERIVRDDEELDRVRAYIRENPARWADDEENPSHPS